MSTNLYTNCEDKNILVNSVGYKKCVKKIFKMIGDLL